VKLPELTDSQFFDHWRDPHGTMTRRIPQFRRYAQNHGAAPRAEVPGLASTPYLGIATVWVDRIEDLVAANADPNFPPLDADGDKMYDRSQLAWLIGQETIVRLPPPLADWRPAKILLLLKSGANPLDAEAMRLLAGRAIDSFPTLAGLAWVLPLEAGAPFDAIIELTFADQIALAAAWGKGGFLTDIKGPVDLASSRGFRANEERVIWP